MKGKELKNEIYKIELKDGKHNVVFDMNTLCELEDIYGDINTALKSFKEQPIKALRSFICAIIRSESDKNSNITIKEAGRLIDMSKMEKTVEIVGKAISEAMPTVENQENEDDSTESPNV